MQTEQLHNPEDANEQSKKNDHIPFDGFVNVNDIVSKRRQLRMAQFNNPDQAWDAEMNPEKPEDRPAGNP